MTPTENYTRYRQNLLPEHPYFAKNLHICISGIEVFVLVLIDD